MVTAVLAHEDRREFLRTCGRWTVLALLGGAALALARQGKLQPLNAACLGALPCGGCPAFARCDLPAARAAHPTQ